MKTLTIRLAGPLQSYGNEATLERRTTGEYPSKSAVVGMLSAALGYRRDDPRITTLNSLNFAVRVDQPGEVLTDLQIAEWKTGERKLTHRDYLQDALFMVAVGSEDGALIEQLHRALQHPRFQPFLGRRANVPAGVLRMQVVLDQNPLRVLESLTWQASDWYQQRYQKGHGQAGEVELEIYADADLLTDRHSTLVKDRVVSFDQRSRRYGFRAMAVKRIKVTNPLSMGQEQTTGHDPLSVL